MDISDITPILRMLERSLIVAGGIISIYLGYRMFVLGIDNPQGSASAFGVQLKNFGPGLFFAALGAVILITTMKAAISVESPMTTPREQAIGGEETRSANHVFFGMEDTNRINNQWTETSFFLETRQLLRRLDKGESPDSLKDLRAILKGKLDSITMNAKEYSRYQELTQKLPLNEHEQSELQNLEKRLFP